MAQKKDQPNYFLQYLSLAPVLAVLSVVVSFTTWVLINYSFPDILMFPNP